MLHPNQFEVGQAWIAFVLNEAPIETLHDGAFDCVCLMDAASCFILATAMVPWEDKEPSKLESRRLFKAARAHGPDKPGTLYLPSGQFLTHLTAEAERQGIEVMSLDEAKLLAFIEDARDGFREHLQRGAAP